MEGNSTRGYNLDVFSDDARWMCWKFPHRREEEFASMDDNGDGVVTQEELTKYLDPTHEQRAISEANYLITMADRDSDGYMSEKEMLMNYKLFTGSSMANYAGYLHDEF